MRRSILLALLALLALVTGCRTPIRFDLVRPARVTPPGPGTPYQVLGLEVPEPVAAAPAYAAAGPAPVAQPTSGGAVVVTVPIPAEAAAFMNLSAQPASVGPYEVLRLDASTLLAQRVSDGVAGAIASSPSPNQILVVEGGRVLVGGQVLEASYVETETQEHTRCDHEVTDRAGRSRNERVPCIQTTRRGHAHCRIQLRVYTPEGQVLFDDALSSDAAAERFGRTSLDGSWATPGEPLVPQAVLDEAIHRLVVAAQRVVVPWRQAVNTDWLDARGYADHDLAREHAGQGRFEESLALLDAMLGTTGRVRPSGRDQARLLANRSVLRLAMGRYEEALIDMEEAVAFLPGCIAGNLLRWTREIVAEQATVRAQGITQPLGGRTP
ncbi:MAG: hypothetical protein OHK0013_46840 [Sandaracinaceae bacterium]